MPKAFTPEWDLNIQNQAPATARPDSLLPRWDKRAELNSFTGSTKHPGSKPGFGHRHHHRQTELGQHVVRQAAVLSETQSQPKIEGIEAVDSPLMAAVFFSALANNEFMRKNGLRLLVIALTLALTTCLPQQSAPEPENPPAVVVVTNTPLPDLGLTQPSTPTIEVIEASATPFFGAGGPELPGGAPDQIRSLLETGMNLPVTDCVTTPETGGTRDQWDNWIKTLVENGANQTAIDELKATITAKLAAWGINGSTTLELCSGGGGGWSFAVRDKYSKSFWWSYDLKNQRFADRPDQVFNDRDWQFRPMPRKGLKSGLEVEIMMVNGWPLAVSVDSAGRPVQYFDPVLGEFINFYPDPPTPTRTASATSTITNTPRPSAIPATEIPATAIPKPSPTFTLEPSPTTEIIVSPQFGEPPKTVGQLKASMIEVGESPFVDNRVIKDANFNIVEDVDIEGERIKLRGGDWIELKGGKTWIVQCRTLERCDPAFDDSRVYHNTFPVKLLLSFIKPGDYYASAIGARPEKLPVLGIMTVATP